MAEGQVVEIRTKEDLLKAGTEAIDKARAGTMAITRRAGGVAFTTAAEIMEFAKMMAIAGQAVPSHLRGSPGFCLAISMQAVEWEMSPFSVANKSYVVNDRLAYESQLVHAIIEARAPLIGRLNAEFIGEAADRQCRVFGTFRNDPAAREVVSPKLKDIKVKNSPLWTSDPDQQLFYYASRTWCRRWAPDVLLGIYAEDEIEHAPTMQEAPGLITRLQDGPRPETGFQHDADQIGQTLAHVAQKDSVIMVTDKALLAPEPTAKPAGAEKPAKQARRGKTITGPKTGKEYISYATRWIEEHKGPAAEMTERWEDEREMRDKLAVSIKDRNLLKAALDGHAAAFGS